MVRFAGSGEASESESVGMSSRWMFSPLMNWGDGLGGGAARCFGSGVLCIGGAGLGVSANGGRAVSYLAMSWSCWPGRRTCCWGPFC